MNRNEYPHLIGQASDWLTGTAKRNPEAFLVLAAGCALLLRGRRNSPSSSNWSSGDYQHRDHDDFANRVGRDGNQISRSASNLKDRVSEVTSDYASSVSNSARSYASNVADYADDARRRLASQASRVADQASDFADQTRSAIRSGAGSVMLEQPLATAVLGVAAGAALAAIFPPSEVEQRTLRPARDALTGAARDMGERMREAAAETGERLKQRASEQGLTTDGMKDIARDAVDTFTSKMSGKAEGSTAKPSSATTTGSPKDNWSTS
jgi:gas vesicle protein